MTPLQAYLLENMFISRGMLMDSCWLHFMMLTWVCLFVCMKDREIIMLCMLFVQTWLCYFLSVYFILIHKAEERAVSSLSSLKTALHSSLFYSSSPWNIVLSFLYLSILRAALIFIWNFENRKTWFSLAKITLLDLSFPFFSVWCRTHELIFVFTVCAFLKLSLKLKRFRSEKNKKACLFLW